MRKFFTFLIRVYQQGISPYKGFKCPYTPSCSGYAIEAINKHGVIKGLMLATWRVLRCNPFMRGKIDPVPDEFLNIRRPNGIKLISVTSTGGKND